MSKKRQKQYDFFLFIGLKFLQKNSQHFSFKFQIESEMMSLIFKRKKN